MLSLSEIHCLLVFVVLLFFPATLINPQDPIPQICACLSLTDVISHMPCGHFLQMSSEFPNAPDAWMSRFQQFATAAVGLKRDRNTASSISSAAFAMSSGGVVAGSAGDNVTNLKYGCSDDFSTLAVVFCCCCSVDGLAAPPASSDLSSSGIMSHPVSPETFGLAMPSRDRPTTLALRRTSTAVSLDPELVS